eukprot:TRINITY_DN124924_c0_g1_i1.p2 TRINITY_DN124924_c0_g1~~TRINITY_DN124924_c0_g1_i1.p2  ORF type:complete len:215 (+),score=39.18 TRINITY_DN124924_c0_g1_i1:96-647(+)
MALARTASSPSSLRSSFRRSSGENEDLQLLGGPSHISRTLNQKKNVMQVHRSALDMTMRHSRQSFFDGATVAMQDTFPKRTWIEPRQNIYSLGKPKYSGQQANELSKWMNAEGLTRVSEETNFGVPTMRQVLRIDDRIDVEQMTKRTGAMPGAMFMNEDKKPKIEARELRHLKPYRPSRRPPD